jgi:hypothetical protein
MLLLGLLAEMIGLQNGVETPQRLDKSRSIPEKERLIGMNLDY